MTTMRAAEQRMFRVVAGGERCVSLPLAAPSRIICEPVDETKIEPGVSSTAQMLVVTVLRGGVMRPILHFLDAQKNLGERLRPFAELALTDPRVERIVLGRMVVAAEMGQDDELRTVALFREEIEYTHE